MLTNSDLGLSVKPAAISANWPQAVLFDLDGTLIDSVPDIAAAVNRLLDDSGLAKLDVDAVRPMIGNGVKNLVQRAFSAHGIALEGRTLSDTTDQMMGIYGEHLIVDTTLMAGAYEAVADLAGSGVRVAIVTNKPENFSRRILDHFGFADCVDVVTGGDTGPARKPAPDMLVHALAELGVPADGAVMVGDGPADIDAARAVPMASIGVRGGYTPRPVEELGADLVVDDLTNLANAIQQLSERA